MKIIYAENPLATKILLDDKEKEIFKLKMRFESMEDMLYETYFQFSDEHPGLYNPVAGLASLKQWVTNQDAEDPVGSKHFDDCFNMYMLDIEGGEHGGDCTCFPCSCSKCHAESLLGVDTIPGLGKHLGSQLNAAFREVTTCADAITILSKPHSMEDATGDKSWWKPEHLERWNKERRMLVDWLTDYQSTKLGKEVTL